VGLGPQISSGYMPRYWVSGAKPQPPNVFLDIIGGYAYDNNNNNNNNMLW